LLILVDQRSDFYSLGSIFYHILTGKPLFGEYVRGELMTSEDALEIAAAHRSQLPSPPTDGKEPFLDELVLRLLQKLPDLRYQTGDSIFASH
jgi:serine/threonine protein kinase